MSVLVTVTIPLDISVYDQISTSARPQLLAAPGFRAHTVHANEPGSFTVTELWDQAEDHAAFFDATIRPNLPVDVSKSVTELHTVLMP